MKPRGKRLIEAPEWVPCSQRTSGTRSPTASSTVTLRVREPLCRSLTHILNKEGGCLRIHLDVLKSFQWLPIGNVVMLHGSTGSIFGWVPHDFQAHLSGLQFHVPWLQWVINYTNRATINSTATAHWENELFKCSWIVLAKKQKSKWHFISMSLKSLSTVRFALRHSVMAKQTDQTHKLVCALDNCGW